MVQAARIEEYLRSRLPQATDVSVANVQRLPGGASREQFYQMYEEASGLTDGAGAS